jgi:hypothetical protein
MEGSMAPTPEQIADCLKVAQLGGDLDRLAAVCLDQAGRYEGAGKQRLLDCAESLLWAAQLLEAVDGPRTVEEAGAAR